MVKIVKIGGPDCGSEGSMQLPVGQTAPERIPSPLGALGGFYCLMRHPPVWMVDPPAARPTEVVYLWEAYYLNAP